MPKKSDREQEWDDGRTIVNMDVDGMPWNQAGASELPPWRRKRTKREREEAPRAEDTPLTKQEMRMFTWGAMKAALLVAGVMCLGIVLFVLFCVYVWFR